MLLSKNFKELIAKMPPERQARITAKYRAMAKTRRRRYSMERAVDHIWEKARVSGVTRTEFTAEMLELLTSRILRDRCEVSLK